MCGGGGGSGGGGSGSGGGNRSTRGGLESSKSRGSSSSRGNSQRDDNRGNRSSQRAGGIASVGAAISRATSGRGSSRRGNSQRDGNRNRNGSIASQLAARNKANRNERTHPSWGRGSSSNRGNSNRDGNRGNRGGPGGRAVRGANHKLRSGFGGFGGTRRAFGGYPSVRSSSVPSRHSLGNGPAYGSTAGGEFGGGNPFAEEEEFKDTATQVGGFLTSAVNPVAGSVFDLVADARKGRIDFSNVAGLLAPFVGGPLGLAFGVGSLAMKGLKGLGVVPDSFGTVSGKGQPFVDPNRQNDGGQVLKQKPAQGLGYLSAPKAPIAPPSPVAPQQKEAQKPQGLGLGVTMGRSRNRGPRNLGPLAFLRPRYGRVR